MDFKNDSTVHDSFHRAGYDHEEDYFYKLNRELIARNRRALDEAREARAATDQRQAHWMHCPKCGGELQELESYGVKSERCPACGGAFFDKGELEFMMNTLHKEPKSFRAMLKSFLNEATRPRPSGWHQIPI